MSVSSFDLGRRSQRHTRPAGEPVTPWESVADAVTVWLPSVSEAGAPVTTARG